LILIVETSSNICSIAVCQLDGKLLAEESGLQKNSHAEALPQMIKKWMFDYFNAADFNAVCICKGPGSYTGLRIGTSIAKGLCYAKQIPLISCNSFYGMAVGAKKEFPDAEVFISMLDARREDVYAEVFNHNLEIEKGIQAVTLTSEIFKQFHKNEVVVCGNSNEKWNLLTQGFSHIQHFNTEPKATFSIQETCLKYSQQDFEDVAYFEPFYLKEFVPGIPKKTIL